VQDLRFSWYFRLWFGLWIVCAIVAFVSFILVSDKYSGPTFRVFRENASEIEFPTWRFRYSGLDNASNFTGVSCTQDNIPVNTSLCSGNNNMLKCIQVQQGLMSKNHGALSTGVRVKCDINASNPDPWTIEHMIAWEIVGPKGIENYGPNSYSSIWISPNENAWVQLTKTLFVDQKGHYTVGFERSLLYHSLQSNPIHWHIETIINTFEVFVYVDEGDFNGWLSYGSVGGFCFYLVMLHTLAMVGVGVVLPNTSSFLLGDENVHNVYQTIPDEPAQKQPLNTNTTLLVPEKDQPIQS